MSDSVSESSGDDQNESVDTYDNDDLSYERIHDQIGRTDRIQNEMKENEAVPSFVADFVQEKFER